MQWAELLDDIERRLSAVEQGLATGTLAVSPFVMPPGLGPLPAHLEERARRALERTRAMEGDLEVASRRTAEALRLSRAPRRSPAAYVDTVV